MKPCDIIDKGEVQDIETVNLEALTLYMHERVTGFRLRCIGAA